jgi:hypothetical protein
LVITTYTKRNLPLAPLIWVMHVFASTFVEIPSECIEKRMLRDKKTAITTDRPQSKLQI